MASAAQNARVAQRKLAPDAIRKVLGRMAIRDIHNGDATGYYITGLGTKSAVLHELGYKSDGITVNSSPIARELAIREFVKRKGRKYKAYDRATTDTFTTRL